LFWKSDKKKDQHSFGFVCISFGGGGGSRRWRGMCGGQMALSQGANYNLQFYLQL